MTKFYYYILALFIKILMGIIPLKFVRTKLRTIKNNLIANTYNFISIDDYANKKMLSLNNCLSGITKLV